MSVAGFSLYSEPILLNALSNSSFMLGVQHTHTLEMTLLLSDIYSYPGTPKLRGSLFEYFLRMS